MSKAQQRERSAAMASEMKKHPNRYPDSVRRPHPGCGSHDRIEAGKLGTSWKGRSSSTWERGMLGGVLAARAGYGSANIPDELLS